jgi:hypothetical protein
MVQDKPLWPQASSNRSCGVAADPHAYHTQRHRAGQQLLRSAAGGDNLPDELLEHAPPLRDDTAVVFCHDQVDAADRAPHDQAGRERQRREGEGRARVDLYLR